MYNIILSSLFILSTLLPVGVIADTPIQGVVPDEFNEDVFYDFEAARIYQVDGHSMKHLNFDHGTIVNVIPASDFNVRDIIAFECSHEKCEGGYIKELTGKKDGCFFVEGRKDIWDEGGSKRQSMDSRTTYGWLCGDNIEIYGTVFTEKV